MLPTDYELKSEEVEPGSSLEDRTQQSRAKGRPQPHLDLHLARSRRHVIFSPACPFQSLAVPEGLHCVYPLLAFWLQAPLFPKIVYKMRRKGFKLQPASVCFTSLLNVVALDPGQRLWGHQSCAERMIVVMHCGAHFEFALHPSLSNIFSFCLLCCESEFCDARFQC